MGFEHPLSLPPSQSIINDNKSSSKSNSCKICGDKANIINYGALSCQPCKTFFRRNGFHPEIVRPCRHDRQCKVNIVTRRVCAACRLAKCFEVGMSTDLIRKEDYHSKKYSLSIKSNKIQTLKRKTIIFKSQLPTLDLLQNDRSLLTVSEWTLFSNVLHAYDTFSLIPTLHRILKNLSLSHGEIHFDARDALEVIGFVYTSMKSFISSMPDFQVLSINEQQSLFERNLHGISSFCSNIFFRDTYFFDNPECCGSFITVYGLEMIQQIKHIMNKLDPDSTLLKFMLPLIAFSSNSYIVNLHNNMYNDSLAFGTFRLFGSQNVYVELLWKYMIYRYGYCEAALRFARLIKCLLDKIRQSSSIYMTNDIYHDFVDDVVAKTKEMLIISQNEPIPLWGKTLISN